MTRIRSCSVVCVFALSLFSCTKPESRAPDDGTGRVVDSASSVWSQGVGAIESLIVSPDGKLFALLTASQIQIRDTASLQVLSLAGPGSFPAFSPASKSFLAVTRQGRLVEWDSRKGIRKRVIHATAPDERVFGLAFSPNGRFLALVIGLKGPITATKLHLLSWPEGALLTTSETVGPFTTVAIGWSPDSAAIVTAGHGARYDVFRFEGQTLVRTSGKLPYIYGFHSSSTGDGYSFIHNLVFLDPRRVVAIGGSGLGWHSPWTELFVFEPDTGRKVWPALTDPGGSKPPERHFGWPLRISAVPGMATVATFRPHPGSEVLLLDAREGSVKGRILHRDVRTATLIPDGTGILVADPERITSYGLPDGRLKEEVSLTETGIGRPLVSIAPESGNAIVALADGTVRRLDPGTGRMGALVHSQDRKGASVRGWMSLEGNRILVLGAGGLSWYDGSSGKREGTSTYWGHAAAISPTGRFAALATSNYGVTILALPEGGIHARSEGKGDFIRQIAFSPDEKWIATKRQWHYAVELWETSTGRLVQELRAPGPGLSGSNSFPEGQALRFSPDGTYLAASLWRGTGIAVWRLGGEGLRVLDSFYLAAPGEGIFWTFDISPDSRLIAAGNEMGRIVLFNVETRKVLKTFNAHTRQVLSLQFVRDGRGEGLISSSRDGTLQRLKALP